MSAGLSRDDLQGLTIAFAGATSYLAGRVAALLAAGGADVAPILRQDGRGAEHLVGPLRDSLPIPLSAEPAAMAASLQARRVAVAVNCIAAYGRSGETATDMIAANVLAPLALIEGARMAGTRLVLSVGSALPVDSNLYSLTKSHFVDLARMVLSHEHPRLCNLRCEIFYGPGERDMRKMPTMLFHRLAQGAATIPMSLGTQRRDFLYVDDLGSAIGAVIRSEVEAGPGFSQYDVGSGHPITVRRFAEIAKSVSGASTELAFGALARAAAELPDIELDITPLRDLGWAPQVSLEEGIRRSLAEI